MTIIINILAAPVYIVGLLVIVASLYTSIAELFNNYVELETVKLTMPDAAPESEVAVVHDGEYCAIVISPVTYSQVFAILETLRERGYISDDTAEFNPWRQPTTHDLEDSQPEWDM